MNKNKDKCPTCNESYSKTPTLRAAVCSNGFHCCRDCKWIDGQVRRVDLCEFHLQERRALNKFRAAADEV